MDETIIRSLGRSGAAHGSAIRRNSRDGCRGATATVAATAAAAREREGRLASVTETTAVATPADPVPDEFRETIGATLASFIDTKAASLAPLGSDLTPLFDAARHAVAGGKRLRPAFAYWGWRAAGGSAEAPDAIIKAGAAIELVHASALVHDDVMDASATRRGYPAAHHVFTQSRTTSVTAPLATRFGNSAAILLGDLLLSWSDELLCEADVKPSRLAEARRYFDKLRTEVVAGQYLDVLAQTTAGHSPADAMRVVRYKSAKYTVERPLQFGAALAKASPELLRALSSYGVPLGEAFQLRDDILGVFGETSLTGKPSGDDIREGKRTLLMARAYGKATPAQRAVLDQYVGNPALDEAGVDAVQQVLRDTGAVAAVETVIAELTHAALAALHAAPISGDEPRTALRVLTDRVTNRAV
jgi:geranylgeranyl diphosphate synthase type I